ncbi:MAG: hypothetical protein Q7S35_10380, partial [Candidatus Limnocylindrales bacterium]|nr:hypothetical protein [Candidatus Limnocylindrales bacterium]
EADDGDWHANHMATQGTLGGTWTRKLNAGYGGGLSGGQGANGGVYLDRSGDLLFYVMDDGGGSVAVHRSTDSGATWTSVGEQMPTLGQMGGGSGYAIPGYDFVEYTWGHVAGGGVAVGVSALKPPAAVANWARILGTGSQAIYQTFVATTQDVSDRVRAISTSKDDHSDAAGFNIELGNTDGALNTNDGTAALSGFAQPNVKVEIWQWHGVTVNAVKTFTGWTDNVQESSVRQVTVLVGRDQAKKLMSNPNGVAPTAPQTLDKPGYVRDMGNFVYLNKTLAEVLDDLLGKAALDSTITGRIWAASTYVFKELMFSSGTLMAAAKQAASAASMRFWFDEDGLARTAPVSGPQAASVWTFRSYEDLQGFDSDVSDDQTYTRVRIIGKANIGAKYLAEQFVWPGLGQPAGIEYDPLTKTVWYLDQDSNLYRLDPAANMAVVAGPYALGLGYPDGITVDPLDNHLWLSDGYDASIGNNANRKYKKLDRANPTATPLLGPFTNPDGDHCGIHAFDAGGGIVRLYMTTYTSGKLVRMNTDGTENSRVASPAVNPTAITSDGQGGYLLSAWDSVDLYQIDFAGNIVNSIKQPAKNANELGYDSSDGGVYQVFGPANTIVKYAVAGTPSGAQTATWAEVADEDLERQLFGEKRLLIAVDLNSSDPAMAASSARATLARVRQYTTRISTGAVGNPGLQLHDRVTVRATSQGVAAGEYMVRSIRADQTADAGTYLMVMVLEPYRAAF